MSRLDILKSFEVFSLNSPEIATVCLGMNHEATLKLGVECLPSLVPCNGVSCGTYACYNVLLERDKYLKRILE